MNNNKLQERRGSLYSGRWTNEEELYAESIIDEFNAGTIDIPKGLSLRSYLARELQCSPKRISKKYENSGYNGKKRYTGKDSSSLSSLEAEERRRQLARKKCDYLRSREHRKSKPAKQIKPTKPSSSPRQSFGTGDYRGLESFVQRQNPQGTVLGGIPGLLTLPSRGIRADLEWNLPHSTNPLNQSNLLPLTSGNMFPASLGLGSGSAGLTNVLPGSLQHNSLTGTSALLGAPLSLTAISGQQTALHDPSLSLQQLSFRHGGLHLPAALRRPPVLDRVSSESLRRRLEAASYLDEYKRSLQQNQDQQGHS